MIQVVDGIGVGAGKSYFTCGRIMAHMAAGGTVYVAETFGFQFEQAKQLIAERWGVVVEPDQYHVVSEEDVPRIHEVTPRGCAELPVLVVVDEAQQFLNARDWNDKSKRALFSWLCQSRHDDTDLIFISQSANNIDKQVRRLVTEVVRMVNLKTIKVPVLGGLPLFRELVMHQDGTTVMEGRWRLHDKRIFGCYTSKSCRGRHKRLAGEVPRRKLQRVQKKPMKGVLIFGLLCIGVLAWAISKGGPGKKKESESSAVAVAPVATTSRVSTPVPRSTPRPMWEIAVEDFRGFVSDPATNFHALKTDRGWYELGEISNRGLVVGVSDRRVRVVQPDGNQVFVVAEVRTSTRPMQGGIPPASPAPVPEVRPASYDDTMLRRQAGLSAAGDDRMRNVQAGLPSSFTDASESARTEESRALAMRRARAGLADSVPTAARQ